jgi:hypothetical protein
MIYGGNGPTWVAWAVFLAQPAFYSVWRTAACNAQRDYRGRCLPCLYMEHEG